MLLVFMLGALRDFEDEPGEALKDLWRTRLSSQGKVAYVQLRQLQEGALAVGKLVLRLRLLSVCGL